MGSAKQIVNTQLTSANGSAQLILFAFTDHLKHHLLPSLMNRVYQEFLPLRGKPNILKANIAQAQGADLVIECERIRHRLVLVGQHQNKFWHKRPCCSFHTCASDEDHEASSISHYSWSAIRRSYEQYFLVTEKYRKKMA